MMEHGSDKVGTGLPGRPCSNGEHRKPGRPKGNNIMIRPRRSLLFMPGSNARALEKARILPADGIILDLEDSVAPDAKQLARDQIAQAIAASGFGKREIWIRTNSLETSWWSDDVKMAAKARPDGILVPKVSSVADLRSIAG